jgi:hypothetical protein
MRCATVHHVDAVDAEGHLNALSGIFAIASLGAILFFFRRAKAVSLGLLGWWICFVVAFFVLAPGTISGSEDVAGWATEAACAGLVGLVAGGWLGSTIGEPRSSPGFLLSCALLSVVTGAALIMTFWLLSDASCGGWLSAEHVRQAYELDTTFCAANNVLGRWAVLDVATVVSLFLLSARSARRNATARAEERIAAW